jgi:hypothetical protein
MNAWLRPVILAIALAGTTLFGGLLAVSVVQPIWVEQSAREMIRVQLEKTTGEKIDALNNRFLQGKAAAAMQEKAHEIEAARKALADGLPAKVLAIAAEMGVPECECRQRHRERTELRIGSAQQMQARLDALIRSAYLDTADKLLRELRIFSGANALAFALLGLAAWRRLTGAHGASLIPAAATLLVATLASSAIYLWGQNWLHTIVFGSYAGWAQLAYIALVYAWLCDLLFNRARISLHLCQGSMSGTLSPC